MTKHPSLHTKPENLTTHSTILWSTIMVGRQQLSDKREEIRFKVCILLCKNIVPETDHMKRGAYFRVSENCLTWGYHQGMLVMFGKSTKKIFLIR